MTEKQQKWFTVFLVFFNLVFWPWVFFPQFKLFLGTFQRNVRVEGEIVLRQKTSSGMLQRVDYDKMRNIFEFGESQTQPHSQAASPRLSYSAPRQMPAVGSERGVSFQLRSILSLQGKMIATLQDMNSPDRMLTVVKGDVVDGYVVSEVGQDAVVLEKNGQRIRLTLE
jgi:type II secretory pathway component PulC